MSRHVGHDHGTTSIRERQHVVVVAAEGCAGSEVGRELEWLGSLQRVWQEAALHLVGQRHLAFPDLLLGCIANQPFEILGHTVEASLERAHLITPAHRDTGRKVAALDALSSVRQPVDRPAEPDDHGDSHDDRHQVEVERDQEDHEEDEVDEEAHFRRLRHDVVGQRSDRGRHRRRQILVSGRAAIEQKIRARQLDPDEPGFVEPAGIRSFRKVFADDLRIFHWFQGMDRVLTAEELEGHPFADVCPRAR